MKKKEIKKSKLQAAELNDDELDNVSGGLGMDENVGLNEIVPTKLNEKYLYISDGISDTEDPSLIDLFRPSNDSFDLRKIVEEANDSVSNSCSKQTLSNGTSTLRNIK